MHLFDRLLTSFLSYSQYRSSVNPGLSRYSEKLSWRSSRISRYLYSTKCQSQYNRTMDVKKTSDTNGSSSTEKNSCTTISSSNTSTTSVIIIIIIVNTNRGYIAKKQYFIIIHNNKNSVTNKSW
jgi:hypothetical protein